MRYYQNQVLTLTTATLPDAPYSKAAKITSTRRTVVKAKAAVNDIPANTTSLDRRTLDRRLPRHDITKVSHLVIVHVLKHSSSTRTIQQPYY